MPDMNHILLRSSLSCYDLAKENSFGVLVGVVSLYLIIFREVSALISSLPNVSLQPLNGHEDLHDCERAAQRQQL